MRVFTTLAFTACFATATMVANLPAQRSSSQPRTITLTATDNMKFSVSTITARPGELLRVVLTVMGAQPAQQMAHNFVLLKPTADAGAFVMAAAMARDQGYIPLSLKGEVLASTSLASAGQTVTTTFKAPARAGSYPYLCSFPGHYYVGMKGTLIVKP
jgi:azurin